MQVKPIVGNKAIEVADKLTFKAALIPFRCLSSDEIALLPQGELESHLTLVYKALHKCSNNSANAATRPSSGNSTGSGGSIDANSGISLTTISERNNILCYLESISHSAEV